MLWTSCLILAVFFFASSVVLGIFVSQTKYKKGRWATPFNLLFVGVVVSAFFLYFPAYITICQNGDCGFFEAITNSVYTLAKLFFMDGDFAFVVDNFQGITPGVYRGYTILYSIVFLVAPILTFGFILSFFKNLSAYKRYFTHYRSRVFIFSELNEKSISLAKSLYQQNNANQLLVFTDVFETDEEEVCELVEAAKELGAVCFRKDITSVRFSWHSKKSDLSFFIMGEDQTENLCQALDLVEQYGTREHTNLYVFASGTEAELLLTNVFQQKNGEPPRAIRVRRVNEVEALVARNLFDQGYQAIFEGAYPGENNQKEINALVLGLGAYGTEMAKTLPWFCQMDGYFATIHVVDCDPTAQEKFTCLCPELMAMSGVTTVEGESKYRLTVHGGIDVDTMAFETLLFSLPKSSYVFVALGSDEKNIATAVKVRRLCERMGVHPVIQAVVYNSEKCRSLKGVENFKGQAYHIDFIGDLESSYSQEAILESELEEMALKRHLKWGEERAFWQFDYNHKSSVASALHRKMKVLCQIPGIEKEPAHRTPEERQAIRVLEHCRWNAYMRSEGYVYGETRNDLAKTHHCLVPFKELSLQEQEKDDD